MINPVEFDLVYLEQLAAESRASHGLDVAGDRVLRESGDSVFDTVTRRFITCRKGTKTPLTLRECLEESLAPPAAHARYGNALDAWSKAVHERNASDAVYAKAPWQRYWLVTTSDGHIHASTHCCTCNKGKSRTGFALVPYLSGKPVAEAVADLGPALCSVCFPAAPVESKEQARIPARLALCLAEQGCEAFQKARQEAAAKLSARCPGSGQKGVLDGHRAFHACPVCGETSRATPTGKVRPHKPATFWIENDDWKAWDGSSWGPKTRAQVYGSLGEAEAVAAAIGGKARRK